MKARTRTEQDNQIEAIYNMIGKVYRQALNEARRGNLAAIGWLDICAPDWRELVQEKCKNGRVKRIETETDSSNPGTVERSDDGRSGATMRRSRAHNLSMAE